VGGALPPMQAPFEADSSTAKRTVVPLEQARPLYVVTEPQYFEVGFDECLLEGNNKETFAAARAVLEEHGGKIPVHFSKKIKRKISDTTGIASKKIEGAHIPESLSKQVTRFFSLQKAYNAAARHFPKGFPLPFNEEVESQIATSLRFEKIPKEGIEHLLSQIRQLAKNRLR
jgi:hypothetical protein